MKSSKIEDVFNFDPVLEEVKRLSALTFYQPFQSTFDPEFATPQSKSADGRETPASLKNLCRESEKQSLGYSYVGGAPGQWCENRIRSGRGFDSERRRAEPSGFLKNSLPSPGTSTSSWSSDATDSTRRRLSSSSASWSSLSSVSPPGRNPRPSPFPVLSEDRSSRFSGSKIPGSGFLSPCSGSGSCRSDVASASAAAAAAAGLASPNDGRPTSGFVGFPSGSASLSVRSGKTSTDYYEGTVRSPVYYPLMLSPLNRNASQSYYRTGHNRPKMCNFCKNNKEVPAIYLNHYLYDPETKVLTCPVLRKHVCEICGGTGDHAHTLQYCPVNKERGLQAKVPVLLKTRTITNSTGKIRRD